LINAYEILHLEFPRLLHFLANLDKEATSEDAKYGRAEEVTRTNALRRLLVEQE
jgi:hypothetical protein